MTSQPSLRYGFAYARDLLAKLHRDHNSLSEAIASQCKERIADSIFNFCVTGHSIKDWVKDEDSSLCSIVEQLITDTPELAACADISNSSKHKTLSRRIQSGSTGIMSDSELTCDMTTILASSTIPITGFTVRIFFEDGTQMEILDLADFVYKTWKTFLTNNNL